MPAAVIKADAVHLVDLKRRSGEDGRRAADREREARHAAEVAAAYESGVADGGHNAEADGLAALPRLAASLDRAAAEITEALTARAVGDAEELLGYAAEIARWILGRELQADPGAVVGRIRAALDGLNPNGRLVIRVAPATAEAVRRWAEGRDADVVADPSLSPGEARITAGDAGADLTWAQAFNRVRTAFGLDDHPGTSGDAAAAEDGHAA